jgi:hypothetical protein
MTWEPSARKPSVARVCNALLGGYDNYAADRELASRLTGICPDLPAVLRENRAFLARAADWAARQGIRQFADLGTGMPAHPSAPGQRPAPSLPLSGSCTSTATPSSPPTCGRCW